MYINVVYINKITYLTGTFLLLHDINLFENDYEGQS
jgi:hypothetical protein